MSSDAFKNANDIQRLEMGYRLLNSKYGLGSWLSGKVHPLPEVEKKDKP